MYWIMSRLDVLKQPCPFIVKDVRVLDLGGPTPSDTFTNSAILEWGVKEFVLFLVGCSRDTHAFLSGGRTIGTTKNFNCDS